jgi:hypothetical protein
MKNGIATFSLPMHRRFEDALKAGLLLKYQFPHDNIKVCETSSTEEVMQGTAFH